MDIKKSQLNNLGIFALVLVIFGTFIFLFSNRPSSTNDSLINPVSTFGEQQVIDLTAKGGYTPAVINAAANKDTILRIHTKNTFDCSTALVIPELGVQKNLPVNGVTEIPLGAQLPGSEIDGTCSMGMYFFKIKFS